MQLKTFGESLNSTNTIQTILKNTRLDETELQVELASAMSSYSMEAVKTAVVQKELNKDQIRAILVQKGYKDELLETTTNQLATAASTHALGASQASTIPFTTGLSYAFKGFIIKLTEATVAMLKFLVTNPAGWAILGATAIYGIVKATTTFTDAAEKTRDQATELTNAYKEQQLSLESQIAKYKELKESLDKGNLSTDETRTIKEQLLEIQKSLVESYGKEVSNIDLVNGKYKEQLGLLSDLSKEKAEDYVIANRNNFKNAKQNVEKERHYNIGDIFRYNQRKGMNDTQQQLYDYIKSYSDLFEVRMSSKGLDFVPNLHIKTDAATAETLMTQFSKDLQKYIDVNNLDINIDDIQNGLSENISNIKNNDDFKQDKDFYNEYIKAEILSNDSLRPLYQKSIQFVEDYNAALSSGEGVEKAKASLEAVQQSFAGVSNEVEGSQQIFDDLYGYINKDAEMLYRISQAFENDDSIKNYAGQLQGLSDIDLLAINFQDNINSPGEKAFGALIDGLGLTEDEVDDLINKLVELGYVQGDVISNDIDESLAQSTSEMIKQLSGLSDGFSTLQKIYDDVQDDGTFDFASLTSSSMKDNFSDLEAYDDFIKTIANSPNDINACQGAFDNLIKSWLLSKDILPSITEENRNVVESMLSGFGITNADEIVNQILGMSSLIENAENEYLNYHTKSLENKNDADLAYLESSASNNYKLAEALGSTYQADYNNWIELLDQKAEAYNNFVNAIKGSESSLGTGYAALSSKSMAEMIISESSGKTVLPASNKPSPLTRDLLTGNTNSKQNVSKYTKEQVDAANQYLNASNEADQMKNNFKLDLSNISTGFGSSLNINSPSGGSGSGGSASANTTVQTFNFIETAISRISSAIDKLKQKANNAALSFKSRINANKEALAKVTEEINAQENAYAQYMARADAVGLEADYIAKIQNGSLSIEDIADDGLKQRIQDYQTWYEKALDCQGKIDELTQSQKEMTRANLDMLITKYDKLASKASSANNRINNSISLKETLGFSASAGDYASLNKNNHTQISYLNKQNDALKEQQKTVKKNSETWYEYQASIDSNNESIQNLTKSIAENAIAAAGLSRQKTDKKNDKLDDDNELLDAKIDNTTSAAEKNKYIGKQTKNKASQLKNLGNTIKTDKTNLAKAKGSLTGFKKTKANAALLKEIKAYIKKHPNQKLSEELLKKAGELDDNGKIFKACVKYNSFIDQLDADTHDYDLLKETNRKEEKDAVESKIQNVKDESDTKKADTQGYAGKNSLIAEEMDNLDAVAKTYNGKVTADKKKIAKTATAINKITPNKKNKNILADIKNHIKNKPNVPIPDNLLKRAKALKDQTLYKYCIDYNNKAADYISDKELADLANASVKKSKTALAVEQMQNISEDFSQKKEKNDSEASILSSRIAQIQASGGKVPVSLYKEQIALSQQKKKALEEEKKALEDELALQVKLGNIKVDSDEYNNWKNQINGVTASIYDEMAAEEAYYDSMIQTRIDGLNEVLNTLNKMNEANERALSLQKAKYNLERAMNQKTSQVLTKDGLVWQTNQNDIREAQETLQDVEFKELINTIQDAIEALEKLKKEDGLYDADGNLTEAGKDAFASLANMDSTYMGAVLEALKAAGFDELVENWSKLTGVELDNQTTAKTTNQTIKSTTVPTTAPTAANQASAAQTAAVTASNTASAATQQNPVLTLVRNTDWNEWTEKSRQLTAISTQIEQNHSLKTAVYLDQAATRNENVKTMQFNGDLSFPNIKSGNDAELLIKELMRLETEAQQFMRKK